jgi:hypothetical protein
LTAALQASTPHTPAGMPTSFAVFAVCWIAIWIASWIFYSKASYQTKKSAHPFLIVAFGVIFLGFTEWVMQGKLPLLFVAALIVIMYLNFRNTNSVNAVARPFIRADLRVQSSAQNAARHSRKVCPAIKEPERAFDLLRAA